MTSMTGYSSVARRSRSAVAALLGLGALMALCATESVAQTRPALVRDVDSQPRSARWTHNFSMSFQTGSFTVTETFVPTIPPGKKLFLQSVNTHTLLTDGQSLMDARLTIQNPSVVAQLSIDQDFQAAVTQRHFTGHLASSSARAARDLRR